MALEVGSRLGHYDVTALIGEGGMGQRSSAGVPIAVLVAVALMISGAVLGSELQLPSQAAGALQEANVRFEVRRAEDQPTPGLREAVVAGSERVIYLYEEAVVTNDDIEESRVVPGNSPSVYGVEVEFNEAGAESMREATAIHIGKPMAILLDGVVVVAPVVMTVVGTAALISESYTQAEAERIVDGIDAR